MINKLKGSIGSALFVLCFMGLPGSILGEDVAGKAVKPVQEAIEIRQQTQKSEDQWAAEKDKLAARYAALEKHIAEQAQLRDAQSRDLDQHTRTVADLNQKIAEMEQISAKIEPYIAEVYTRIKTHVSQSPPFLKAEREARIAKLGEVLSDPQVKTSEKFRRLTETLMIEAEYGSTIEVYPESILLNGREVQMQIFRLGRLSLFCESLDKKTTGYFDVAEGRWEVLPEKYNSDIHTAMDIGAKRRPVDLVELPIGRMAAQ